MSNGDGGLAQRVADELEVRNVIVRLGMYADGLGTVDEYVDLFTEDGEWLMPGAPRRGHAELRAGSEERRAAGGVGPGTNTRHVVGATTVSFPTDDEAVADSYWQFYVDTVDAPRLQIVGVYRDTLRRTPRGWRVARREITFG